MKKILLFIFVLLSFNSFAQKVDSIFINLYTDSLKKGTHNYINVDGLMHDGSYRPLDSTFIHFESDYGHFEGNSLVLDRNPTQQKVRIKIYLKNNKNLCKEITLFIKQKEDPELPSQQQILDQMRKEKKNKGKDLI